MLGHMHVGGELRAKPEPRARSAWKMRAKPESRAEPEIEWGRGLGRGLGEPSPEFFWKFAPETVQSGVCLTVPAQELSAEVAILPRGPSIKYVTLQGGLRPRVWVSVKVCNMGGVKIMWRHTVIFFIIHNFYVLFFIFHTY